MQATGINATCLCACSFYCSTASGNGSILSSASVNPHRVLICHSTHQSPSTFTEARYAWRAQCCWFTTLGVWLHFVKRTYFFFSCFLQQWVTVFECNMSLPSYRPLVPGQLLRLSLDMFADRMWVWIPPSALLHARPYSLVLPWTHKHTIPDDQAAECSWPTFVSELVCRDIVLTTVQH